MFLSKSLGITTLNLRRLLILSSIVLVCAQAKNSQISACKDIGLGSTALCEGDKVLFATNGGKSNSKATAIDENDITANDLSARAAKNGDYAAVGVVFAQRNRESGSLETSAGPKILNGGNSKINSGKGKRSYDDTHENLLPSPGTPSPSEAGISPVQPANPIVVPMKVARNWNLWKRT